MANGTRPPTLLLVFAVSIVGSWFVGCSRREPQPVLQPTSVPTAAQTPTTLVPAPIQIPKGPYPAAKHWTITVGPDACDVMSDGQPVPVAVVSKEKLHGICFQPNAGQTLGIVFHVAKGHPKPFKEMDRAGSDAQENDLWRLVCKESGNKCCTGPAQKDADETYYKYDQTLDGKTCDAGIIIEK